MNENQDPLQPSPEEQNTEKSSPESTVESSPAPVVATKPKSNKKSIFVLLLLIIILLLLCGLPAIFLVFNNTDTNNPSTLQQTEVISEFIHTPNVLIQNANKLQYVNDQNEVVDYITLETNEKFIEAYIDNEKTVVTYVVSEIVPNGSRSVYLSYGKIVDGKKQPLINLPDNVNSFSNPSLSPDKDTLVVEVGDEGDFMQNLSKVNILDGSVEIVYEPQTREDRLRTVIGWLDNDTVLLQQQTCRQCDGPRLPVLYSLDINSKTATPYFNADNSLTTISYASFYFSGDKSRLFMYGGDYGKIFAGEIGQDYDPTIVYEIDLEAAESREITRFTSGYENFVGVSQDGSTVFVTTAELVETDRPDAPFQSIDGNYILDTPTLYRVNTQTGGATEVQIESRLITQGTYYGRVLLRDEGTLLLTVVNQPEVATQTYSLLQLSSGTENKLNMLLENSFGAGSNILGIFQL